MEEIKPTRFFFSDPKLPEPEKIRLIGEGNRWLARMKIDREAGSMQEVWNRIMLDGTVFKMDISGDIDNVKIITLVKGEEKEEKKEEEEEEEEKEEYVFTKIVPIIELTTGERRQYDDGSGPMRAFPIIYGMIAMPEFENGYYSRYRDSAGNKATFEGMEWWTDDFGGRYFEGREQGETKFKYKGGNIEIKQLVEATYTKTQDCIVIDTTIEVPINTGLHGLTITTHRVLIGDVIVYETVEEIERITDESLLNTVRTWTGEEIGFTPAYGGYARFTDKGDFAFCSTIVEKNSGCNYIWDGITGHPNQTACFGQDVYKISLRINDIVIPLKTQVVVQDGVGLTYGWTALPFGWKLLDNWQDSNRVYYVGENTMVVVGCIIWDYNDFQSSKSFLYYMVICNKKTGKYELFTRNCDLQINPFYYPGSGTERRDSFISLIPEAENIDKELELYGSTFIRAGIMEKTFSDLI